MRFPRRDPWPAAPEFEHIARFGDAEIVKDLRGRLSIRGGTAEDQAAARAWAALFLNGPLHQRPQIRYTIMPRPERPAPQQRPLAPLPPVCQPPTPEE